MPLSKEPLRIPTKLEVGELRRLKNPPPSVRRCLELAILVIHSQKYEGILNRGRTVRVDWERDVLRTLVNFETIITAMTDIQKTKDTILAAPALRKYLAQTYLEGPDALTYEKVRRSSGPAGVVLRWFSECLTQADAYEADNAASSDASSQATNMPKLRKAAQVEISERFATFSSDACPQGSHTTSLVISPAMDACELSNTLPQEDFGLRSRSSTVSQGKTMPSSELDERKSDTETRQERRPPVKQRSLTAAAAHKLLREAEDRRVKDEEDELSSRGMKEMPPPGSPPKHKIATRGALSEFKPKHQTSDPQQSLMMALSGSGTNSKQRSQPDNGPCDKCDGKHATDACPYYPNAREKHSDAWSNYGNNCKGRKDENSQRNPFVLKGARVVPQPGDGSCMFHSLAYCIGGQTSPKDLRKRIAEYIAGNSDSCIGGTPIKDWVLWDSGLSIRDYTARMATGNHWGGAIELAVCSLVKNILVHVYESSDRNGEFTRISTFGDEDSSTATDSLKVIHVLYSGRVHYDALIHPTL